MKKIVFQILAFLILVPTTLLSQDKSDDIEIEKAISSWHKAAAEANFDTYFSLMTSDAIFIGTDPTEYWKGKEFRDFAKPYFDKGKAWTFRKLDRNIFVDLEYKIAWFDELLDTQMGICRGSGVLVKIDEEWKINHYVLSITIPNENVDVVKKLKSQFEAELMQKLKN